MQQKALYTRALSHAKRKGKGSNPNFSTTGNKTLTFLKAAAMSLRIKRLFSRISKHYDVANDVLSLGMHRLWRRKLLKAAQIQRGQVVLDLCTGTGEVALAAARHTGTEGMVAGIDFVPQMLALAAKKISNNVRVQLLLGDAMGIPLKDSCADRVLIAYGIRNVDYPPDCLKEIYRVLKPGGLLVVLEFGKAASGSIASAASLYCQSILPRLGGAIARDKAAYEYLSQSSKAFPAGEEFVVLLREAGFSLSQFQPLFPGVAYLYIAVK